MAIRADTVLTIWTTGQRRGVAYGIKSRDRPGSGAYHRRMHMDQIANQFGVAPRSQGIGCNTWLTVIKARHAIEKMREARKSTAKSRCSFLGRGKAMANLNPATARGQRLNDLAATGYFGGNCGDDDGADISPSQCQLYIPGKRHVGLRAKFAGIDERPFQMGTQNGWLIGLRAAPDSLDVGQCLFDYGYGCSPSGWRDGNGAARCVKPQETADAILAVAVVDAVTAVHMQINPSGQDIGAIRRA